MVPVRIVEYLEPSYGLARVSDDVEEILSLIVAVCIGVTRGHPGTGPRPKDTRRRRMENAVAGAFNRPVADLDVTVFCRNKLDPKPVGRRDRRPCAQEHQRGAKGVATLYRSVAILRLAGGGDLVEADDGGGANAVDGQCRGVATVLHVDDVTDARAVAPAGRRTRFGRFPLPAVIDLVDQDRLGAQNRRIGRVLIGIVPGDDSYLELRHQVVSEIDIPPGSLVRAQAALELQLGAEPLADENTLDRRHGGARGFGRVGGNDAQRFDPGRMYG